MLSLARNYMSKALQRFGWAIQRMERSDHIADLRDQTNDPIEAFYLARGRSFLLQVPIEKCHFIEFSGTNEHNPFVLTLVEYARGSCTSYYGSPLQHFYNFWQPGNSLLYFKNGRELAPPWYHGFKKENHLAEARLNRREFVRVRRELGLSDKDISGHIKKGPVSEAFGHITFNRFVQIFDSIRQKGYHPEKTRSGHIRGSICMREDDYRVSIGCGKHRVTALQALGYRYIPVQFDAYRSPVLVRRSDVLSWPNVRAGNYTPEEALRYFDQKFLDEHPSGWRWPGGTVRVATIEVAPRNSETRQPAPQPPQEWING